MLIVIGTVIQDVVADAMSTEVVSRARRRRQRPAGGRGARRARHGPGARPPCAVGSAFWRSPDYPAGSPQCFARETVFLLGLIVPAISVIGVLLIRSETSERRPLDWRILGGGMAFGRVVLALALGGRAVRTGVDLRRSRWR